MVHKNLAVTKNLTPITVYCINKIIIKQIYCQVYKIYIYKIYEQMWTPNQMTYNYSN